MTAENGRGFFFEYNIITMVIFLVPLYDLKSVLRNVVVDYCAVLLVTRFTSALSFQDWVDIGAMQMFFVVISQIRWRFYAHYEELRLRMLQEEKTVVCKARSDALTGLFNRMALRDDFSGFLSKQINLALFDVDDFKRLNDTFGHVHGDEVLAYVGEEVSKAFPGEGDHCYRYGGDEFLIVSEIGTSEDFASRLVRLHDSCVDASDMMQVKISIGYTSGTPMSAEDLRGMIQAADHWLYQAKQSFDKVQGGVFSGSEDTETEDSDTVQSGITLKELEKKYRERQDHITTILYFDIRHFAEIVSRLGRAEGIHILNQTMQVLCDCFGAANVSHMEPDMFLAMTSMDPDHTIASVRSVQKKVLDMNASFVIILCAGIFPCEPTGKPKNFLEMMANARYACWLAGSSADSNRYLRIFDEDMKHTLEAGSFAQEHLEDGIKHRQIVPYYQPLVGSLTGKTYGFEALARWDLPEKGILPPSDFIPWLEKLLLIYKLDLHILRMVCEDICAHEKEFSGDYFVTVNLSRSDFLSCDMFEEIQKILADYSIPKDRIQFEISESTLTGIGAIRTGLKKMKDAGYQLWIDDFGSGESSLSVLHETHVRGVKLDQSFFRNFNPGSRLEKIISSVSELCHHSGLLMVAEGVENESELAYSRNWGMNYIQGYYYSRPLPLSDLLTSPFLKHMSTRESSDYYETAMGVYLYEPLEQRYYASERDGVIFFKAVLERVEGKISCIRMSNAMNGIYQSFAELENSASQFSEDKELYKTLLENMKKADQKQDVIDFPVRLNGKMYHGMIVKIAEYQDRHLYIYSLTNFDIVSPLNTSDSCDVSMDK
ncbi:MAG: EAL domain-containing protein [Bilifractor sp.]